MVLAMDSRFADVQNCIPFVQPVASLPYPPQANFQSNVSGKEASSRGGGARTDEIKSGGQKAEQKLRLGKQRPVLAYRTIQRPTEDVQSDYPDVGC